MAICLLSNGGIIIKIKLILIILIIWLFSPIATSNLAKAAYHRISKGKKDE
jgi:multisubunit Na+/H+ antiporter MnhG subunit